MLRHASEEGAVVIRGQLEVTVGDQRRVLGPGEAYYFDSRLPHRFRNLGDEVCELVSACTPAELLSRAAPCCCEFFHRLA